MLGRSIISNVYPVPLREQWTALRDTSRIYRETIDDRLVRRVDPVHYCIALHLTLARDRIASSSSSSSSSSRQRRKIEERNVTKFSAKRLYGYMDGTLSEMRAQVS